MNVLIGIPNWKLLIKERAQERLLAAGVHLLVNETGGMAKRAFLEENIASADAYIAGGETIDAALLERADRLKVIARYGVGVENIDLACAAGRGIDVTVTAGANANAVAEHTVALILAAFRRIGYYAHAVERGAWETAEFPELSGKCVGLIGFGRIGRLVARRLSGFDVQLLVCDPAQSEASIRAAGGCKRTLEEVLRRSDVVSLHVPALPRGEALIGARELGLMKRGAYLVNTSRGTLVDERALLSALRGNALRGAALDVVAEEPCAPDHPLLGDDRVIITPHIAGGSYENHLIAGEMCVQAVLDALAGKRPQNAVNLPCGEQAVGNVRPSCVGKA